MIKDKKNMKKRWKRIISNMIAIALVIISSIPTISIPVKAEASVDGKLITVGGKTVTKNMKIDDVKKMFGEPKLTTPSYWDGYAYTFYGKDYSDYLYLETDSDGKIVCYGSVSPGFETNKYSYGEKVNPYARAGCEAKDDDGKLYAVIYYTKFHLDAYKRFTENLTENNRNLCKHAVEMWNAISYLYGYKTATYFDEKLFNIGAQLADNHSDLYDYCKSTNQSSCYQSMTGRKATFLEYFYPNPLEFAENARNYECPKGNAIGFMYYPAGEENDDYWIMEGFVNKELLADWKSVAYTEREKELLENSRKYYTNSVNTVNSMKSYYEIKPSYDSIKNIEGGKLSKEVAKGAVDYLNAIRVGAGLNPLEYSEQLSMDAQCKSTYTVYLAKNNIKNSSPHNPPKVEGLSDEYYSKCQSGNGENLYSCGIISTSIIDSISSALDDSQGTGQYYNRGHRYNLLNPEWKYIGVGNTLQQACHKLSGTQSSNVDVVAWPPKGITISESGFSPSGMWTCQFYNKLKPTADTTITIECLNSNKKWKIDPNNLLENQNYERSGDLISYSDDSIVFKIGGVYQITYDHLTDANGNETSYSYRTVYEKAYIGSEEEKVPQSIKLDKTSEKVLLGTTSKLIAKVSPDNIKNKRIYFASNNKEVATVNECGEITAHSLGTADITATSENGNITATCKIIVVKTLDQTDDQPEKEPTKEPEKEPTKEPAGAITNGNVNNSNNKSDLSQGHKTNNSKKENITISKAKIKSAKKKKSSKSLTIILSKAVPKVTGYQIKIYSSKKKAKKNKGAIWTKVVQTNSKKIVIKNKKLKNKKTLYIRIRAYKRINRKNKYSTWSEIKKVIVN
ncbi:MAG: Ig-like domain-containing protein [Anaerostipes hadrus]